MTDRFKPKLPKVAIIGAGVIGLGIAWRLAARGVSVDVFDRGTAGAGASHAAAGMLAACCEAEPGEDALVALGRESQARWPAFAAELLKASGIDVELRQEGTLVVALTADDQARLHHHLSYQEKLGLPLQWISAAETRRKEPHLAGKLAGAVWSPEDHQVDNRKLAAALRVAAEAAGATIREHTPVREFSLAGGRVDGVILGDGGKVAADVVVLAAGAWSRTIGGLPPEQRPPVRPIKGQMLALKMDPAAPLATHVIWAPGVYLVPRRDGRLIVGATVEEKAFDTSLTAGGLLTLLEAAWRTIPAVEELPIDEMWVGHRPGSRDDAPILGHGPAQGLIYATGHHRNGILLAPVTVDTIAKLVLEGALDPQFGPSGSIGLLCLGLRNKVQRMTQAALNASIRVNGQEEPLAASTLAGLLADKAVDVGQRGIAVALNGQVVPRAEWPSTPLNPGDAIEIVRARQGG